MTAYLEVNPSLDPATFAKTYQRDGVVQVPDLLTAQSAELVAAVLETKVAWRLTLFDENDPAEGRYDQARLQQVGLEAMNAKVGGAIKDAGQGFSYIYLSYPMITAYKQGWDPGHPLHALSELLNSADFLDLVRAITGRDDILKADAQATFYRPGDFLTLHDDGAGEGRIAAYTLGFTRAWRPDWGGQLLFHGDDGEIRRGLAPAFNTLTLFKVPQPHSVAAVAPYAAGPRLSVVGWARNDAPKPA